MNSLAEENYLKAIYSIIEDTGSGASTNAICEKLETKASSATVMVKKLAEKHMVNYEKYQGVTLTDEGKTTAVDIIRKHRLWEVFLVEKLGFKWDQVHEVAEQLEHIKSKELTLRLEHFLNYPKFDPHGDPIPTSDGKIELHVEAKPLSEIEVGKTAKVVGVLDSSAEFLQYLDSVGIGLGATIKIQSIQQYDMLTNVVINKKRTATLSEKVCHNLQVEITSN